jgi:hypothetical protein
VALDFTTVINVRNQFGDDDEDIGVFAGTHKEWTFKMAEARHSDSYGLLMTPIMALLMTPGRGVLPASVGSSAAPRRGHSEHWFIRSECLCLVERS